MLVGGDSGPPVIDKCTDGVEEFGVEYEKTSLSQHNPESVAVNGSANAAQLLATSGKDLASTLEERK